MKPSRIKKPLKVGIFISGQIRFREAIPNYLNRIRNLAPNATIIGACWDTCVSKYGFLEKETGIKIHVFPEPEINYHPFEENEFYYQGHEFWETRMKSMKERGIFYYPPSPDNEESLRMSRQVKQLIIHNELIRIYQNEFDVIVRGRWDQWVGQNLELEDLFQEVYVLPAVVTLTQRQGTFPISINSRIMTYDSYYSTTGIPVVDFDTREITYRPHYLPWLHDAGFIIHRPHVWNVDLVDSLIKNKNLLPAEWGWYQVLIEHGRSRYRHWDGGVEVVRDLRLEDYKRPWRPL